MSPGTRSFFLRILAVGVAASLLSCSSATKGEGGTITRVKYYHLLPTTPLLVMDQAIMFERQHHLYGAVSKADMIERGGHYYTVFWKVKDRSSPVTVRFEYRQANDALTTKTQEIEVSDIRRSNVSRFQVTGDEYNAHGRVTAWRVTVLRGKEELVSHRSYLWN